MEWLCTLESNPIGSQQWRRAASQVGPPSSMLLLSDSCIALLAFRNTPPPAQQVTNTFGFMRKININLCQHPVRLLSACLSTIFEHSNIPQMNTTKIYPVSQKIIGAETSAWQVFLWCLDTRCCSLTVAGSSWPARWNALIASSSYSSVAALRGIRHVPFENQTHQINLATFPLVLDTEWRLC